MEEKKLQSKKKIYLIALLFTPLLLFLTVASILSFKAINLINRTLVSNLQPYQEGREIIINIKPGSNTKTLAKQLSKQKFIKKDEIEITYFMFKYLYPVTTLHSAEYQILPTDTIKTLSHKLNTRQYHHRSITIVEGETAYRIKQQLLQNPHLSGKITETIKEGELMPSTYHFTKGTSKDEIIRMAKDEMKRTLDQLFSQAQKNPKFYLKTKEEFITLASIVQQETFKKDEMKLVAAVFKNRLRRGMRLQSCVTTIYDITKGAYKFNRRLTFKDTKKGGEYNTYVRSGLPVGPICSPGKDAMQAVVDSIELEHDYLFFVTNKNKEHYFTKSLTQHREFAAEYSQYLEENTELSL